MVMDVSFESEYFVGNFIFKLVRSNSFAHKY